MIRFLFQSRSGVVCSVHESAEHATDLLQRAEELHFVRDGFSWLIALLTPIGLMMRGAWLALALYFAAVAMLLLAVSTLGLPAGLGVLLILAVGVVFGFEAATIERWSLGLFGWQEVGVVGGADIEECERRFFDAWLSANAPKPLPPIAAHSTGSDRGPSLLRRLFASRP